jgi:hypothetical protein
MQCSVCRRQVHVVGTTNLGIGNTTVERSRRLKLYEIVRSARFLSLLSCVCGMTLTGEFGLSFDLRPSSQFLKITSVCESSIALFARSLGKHAQILQKLDGLASGGLCCLE